MPPAPHRGGCPIPHRQAPTPCRRRNLWASGAVERCDGRAQARCRPRCFRAATFASEPPIPFPGASSFFTPPRRSMLRTRAPSTPANAAEYLGVVVLQDIQGRPTRLERRRVSRAGRGGGRGDSLLRYTRAPSLRIRAMIRNSRGSPVAVVAKTARPLLGLPPRSRERVDSRPLLPGPTLSGQRPGARDATTRT